ncbi:MAG: hypothetical protein AAF596_10540, partial [Planctomycetota bacterium]
MNATRTQRAVGVGGAAVAVALIASTAARSQQPSAEAGLIDPRAAAKQPNTPGAQPQALPPAPVGGRALQALVAETAGTPSERKALCGQLLQAARAAMVAGDLARAEQLGWQATALGMPEDQFAAGEDSPARLAWDLQMARYRNDAVVQPALAVEGDPYSAGRAIHVDDGSQNEASANRLVALQAPGAPGAIETPAATEIIGPRLAQAATRRPEAMLPDAIPTPPGTLIEQGEQRLRTGDFAGALELFQQADAARGALTPALRRRLDSHLDMLADGTPAAAPPTDAPARLAAPGDARSLLDDAQTAQQRLARQLSADIGTRQLDAKRLRETDPRGALEMLKELRAEVEKTEVSEQIRGQLIARVDRAIADTDKYISDNRAQIELDEANAAVLAEVDRRRATNLKMQDKKAQLVDEFNRLRDEQRYAEAEIVAKRLYEMMGPHDEVASVIMQT